MISVSTNKTTVYEFHGSLSCDNMILFCSNCSVIPKALIGPELTGSTVGDLIAVSDMHQRKAEMARQSDAFIALPGAFSWNIYNSLSVLLS